MHCLEILHTYANDNDLQQQQQPTDRVEQQRSPQRNFLEQGRHLLEQVLGIAGSLCAAGVLQAYLVIPIRDNKST
jgi:hypothetical protein